MVQWKVVEEDQPVAGKDFFEPSAPPVLAQHYGTEKLADTPAVIARVWRGAGYRRRMVPQIRFEELGGRYAREGQLVSVDFYFEAARAEEVAQ